MNLGLGLIIQSEKSDLTHPKPCVEQHRSPTVCEYSTWNGICTFLPNTGTHLSSSGQYNNYFTLNVGLINSKDHTYELLYLGDIVLSILRQIFEAAAVADRGLPTGQADVLHLLSVSLKANGRQGQCCGACRSQPAF